MDNKFDKNFLKQIVVIFVIILTTNYVTHLCLGSFSQKGYQRYYHSMDKYLPDNNNDIVKKLFTDYEPYISINNIPKTFKEYQKSENTKTSASNDISYEILNNIPCFYGVDYMMRKKYIHSLEPRIHKNFPYTKADLYPYKNLYLFYNKYGELLFILKQKDSFIHYTYNIQGELLEAKYESCNEYIVYNSNKQPKYSFGNFGETFEFITYVKYPKYLLILNIFILLTSLFLTIILILFKLRKIYNFPAKVSEKFLDEFQNKNNFKNPIQYLYHQILKTKVHLWSHILTFVGLFSLICIIFQFLPFVDLFGILSSILASIFLFGFIIIETIFLRKFRIKWEFVYENKIYNIFWHLGLIGYIVFIIFIFKNLT